MEHKREDKMTKHFDLNCFLLSDVEDSCGVWTLKPLWDGLNFFSFVLKWDIKHVEVCKYASTRKSSARIIWLQFFLLKIGEDDGYSKVQLQLASGSKNKYTVHRETLEETQMKNAVKQRINTQSKNKCTVCRGYVYQQQNMYCRVHWGAFKETNVKTRNTAQSSKRHLKEHYSTRRQRTTSQFIAFEETLLYTFCVHCTCQR